MKKTYIFILLLFTTFVAFSRGEKYIDLHKKTFIKDSLLIFTNCDNGTSAFVDIILKYLGKVGQGIIAAEMEKE
jgi:hypothetical protein